MYFIVRGNQVFSDTVAQTEEPAIQRIISVIQKHTGQKKTWDELVAEGFSTRNLKLEKGSRIETLNI